MNKKSVKHGIIALLSTLFVVSIFAGTAYAVTNGQPDGENHPYVCLVVADVNGAPAWRGSGVLIAPTIVLTAGHITDGATATRVWFYSDVTYDKVPFPLYPYGGPGSGAIEGTPYTYAGYTSPIPGSKGNGVPTFSAGDVGIIVLDEPVILDEYGVLPEAGYVDTLAVSTPVDLVGYGVQYQLMAFPGMNPRARWTGPRVRMYAPATTLSGSFSWSDQLMQLSANPGNGKGGTAFGDSGGPILQAGTNLILAVNSYVVNVNCAGVTYAQRVDIEDVLEWISTFMP